MNKQSLVQQNYVVSGRFTSTHHGLLDLHIYECRLKQSLVQHTFFPALEGYVVNTLAFPLSLMAVE